MTGPTRASKPLDIRKGFGRDNPYCMKCGDERGGPYGHETNECQYRHGMTAEQVAATMPPETAREFWDTLLDRYFEQELEP